MFVCLFVGGGLKCSKNVTIHGGAVLSINAGENWLGIGAADNTMSLFHRPHTKMSSWQLYRTPQKALAMVIINIHSFFIVLR